MTPARRRQLARLELFYREPDELDTLEQWQTRWHQDLAVLSRPELRAEFAKVRLRLLLDENPSAWFLEREQALREALRRAA